MILLYNSKKNKPKKNISQDLQIIQQDREHEIKQPYHFMKYDIEQGKQLVD